jgi:hypothetical protein
MANPITVSATHDYTADAIGVASSVTFSTSESFPTATFYSSQLDPLLTLTGDAGADDLTVVMDVTGTFSVAGWTFANWFADHFLVIYGTSGSDTIVGGDLTVNYIIGGLGADTLSGGGLDDSFNYFASSIAAGESIAGGGGTDTIYVGAGGSYDFTLVGIAGVEALKVELGGPPQSVTVRLSAGQIGAGAIATVNGFSPTGLVVVGSHVDLSGVAFPVWVSGSTVTITGHGRRQYSYRLEPGRRDQRRLRQRHTARLGRQ